MPRAKKTRKIGKIGVSKENSIQLTKSPIKKKTTKGNKPGSRQQTVSNTTAQQSVTTRKNDVRYGSKQKIELDKYRVNEQPVKTAPLDPFEELTSIENDTKLEELLAKAESGLLAPSERQYLDEKLSRHKFLCELLGISESDDSDPFSSLEAIRKEDFED